MDSELTWYQNARLHAIEILSLWHGHINTSDIIKQFGISRQIAQRDIKTYLSLAPGNLSYHKSDRAYLITSIFRPRITSGLIDEYVALLGGLEGTTSMGSIEYAIRPSLKVDPKRVRPILQSIREGYQVSLRYQSLDHPEGTERIIQPHTLVFSGFRWHVRSYCYTRLEFRDFNLSRIMDTPKINKIHEKAMSMELDEKWNEMVSIKIIANPELPDAEKKLIESEFGLINGVLKLETRAALVHYVLQNYQINTESTNSNPRKDRLLLSNFKELKKHVFDS